MCNLSGHICSRHAVYMSSRLYRSLGKERITAALSRGGYSFRHDSFIIQFSSDFFRDSPSHRILLLSKSAEAFFDRLRQAQIPVTSSAGLVSPSACLHYTANDLICQDFLTICHENQRDRAWGGRSMDFSCKSSARSLQSGHLRV